MEDRHIISFKTTPADRALIDAIVDRFVEEAKRLDPDLRIDRLSLTMDITACHANGNPLKLAELAKADRFDFIHDVGGIRRHIDRETGKLGDCFSPRYSA